MQAIALAVKTMKVKHNWPYLLFEIGFLHCQHFFVAQFSKQVLIFVQAKAFQPNWYICEREERGERREREKEREREERESV